jgi:hypothetical protein
MMVQIPFWQYALLISTAIMAIIRFVIDVHSLVLKAKKKRERQEKQRKKNPPLSSVESDYLPFG